MPAGIFISYRRREALKEARAVFEKLSREFGAGQVFIDLEGLDYGVDFVESLDRQLQHCEVMLVLIGPGWLDSPDGHGGRRLDDPNDFVRIELRTALQRNIRVVPVLFMGTGVGHLETREPLSTLQVGPTLCRLLGVRELRGAPRGPLPGAP